MKTRTFPSWFRLLLLFVALAFSVLGCDRDDDVEGIGYPPDCSEGCCSGWGDDDDDDIPYFCDELDEVECQDRTDCYVVRGIRLEHDPIMGCVSQPDGQTYLGCYAILEDFEETEQRAVDSNQDCWLLPSNILPAGWNGSEENATSWCNKAPSCEELANCPNLDEEACNASEVCWPLMGAWIPLHDDECLDMAATEHRFAGCFIRDRSCDTLIYPRVSATDGSCWSFGSSCFPEGWVSSYDVDDDEQADVPCFTNPWCSEAVDCQDLTEEQCGTYGHCKPFYARRLVEGPDGQSCFQAEKEFVHCTQAEDCYENARLKGVDSDGTCWFWNHECPGADWVTVVDTLTDEERETYAWCLDQNTMCETLTEGSEESAGE